MLVTRMQSTPNFSKNEHFLIADTHTYIRSFVFRKIWRALFSCYLHFEIRLFSLSPTNNPLIGWVKTLYIINTIQRLSQEPRKHLRWIVLQQQITAFCFYLLLQGSPFQMFAGVLLPCYIPFWENIKIEFGLFSST